MCLTAPVGSSSLGRDVDFTGFDVNPLAILICKAKSEVLNGAHYESRVKRVLQRIEKDTTRAIDVTFPERDKWFLFGCIST